MGKEEQKPVDRDFEDRHAEQLGVGRFAKIQAAYALIPLVASAAGYGLGHYLLAKPVTKLFPIWAGRIGLGEAAAGAAAKGLKKLFSEGEAVETAFEGTGVSQDQISQIGAI